jgi:MFS family permease
MLINRSGAMVFPFMSIYLTHHLHFTEIQAGWILSSYGMGSMVGVLAGGWLADKYGSFIVQFISQILSGIGWLLLSQVTMYEQLIFLVFFQSMISDAFRPTNNSSVTAFTDFHNRTKSFSLNRMAMNMGYTVGPAIGGIFATISYTWLFWGDGMSCIISAFFFIFLFRRHFFDKDKKSQENNANQLLKQSNPLKDSLFLCFTGCTILFGTLFSNYCLRYRYIMLIFIRLMKLIGTTCHQWFFCLFY